MENRLNNRFRDIEEVKQNWGWFLALGILLILLGAAVIGTSFYTSAFSIILLGIFLLIAGVVQIIQTCLARKWSGLFLSLFLGLLYIIIGFFCITNPTTAITTLTTWIAAFCFIAGLFRMLAALILRFENWGWVFFNGAVTFILGILIYENWPFSGLWIIGIFVGIDMLLSGWSWILLSFGAKKNE